MTAGFDHHALQRKRTARSLSQQALAEILGVTRQAVSEWERDLSTPLTDSLPSLADALQCSIDDLFTRGDDEIPAHAGART